MSRVTYQDRRDIAENLRNLADYSGRSVQYAEQFRDLLEDEIFSNIEHHDYSDMFERLADLIEPMYEPDPAWVAWVESLKDGDVVDRFAYDLIVHGGDMGPNGNVWDRVDEGTVLTNQLFDKFKADFKKEIEASDSEVVQD
jgi:hypothetical protein